MRLLFFVRNLTVSGHEGELVANSFYKQDGKVDSLVIVLPGLSYRCDAPLLWYPTRTALDLGADVLWVEYAYDRRPDWMGSDDRVQKDWLFEDVGAASKAVLGHYESVTLIGKSLGTLAMGHLLSTQNFPARTKGVWLTPVLSDLGLRRQLERTSTASLLVIGTNDRYYDAEFLTGLKRNHAVLVTEVEGADHSLELKEDVLGSLDVMKRVTGTIRQFIS